MTIGFIGTGNMGLPMAEQFVDAGHQLMVFDTRAEAMAPLIDRQARVRDGFSDAIADRARFG